MHNSNNHTDINCTDSGMQSSLMFTGCTVTDAAQATPAGGRRRQVIVSGKRVKTIDVHAHCVIPKALELMGKDLAAERGPGLGDVGLRRISEMDEQGIDVEAISINPQWYKLGRDLAAAVVKVNNETLAELCAAHPDRFVGFASLTLQHPDLAVQELEYAVKKLGMRGAAIGGNVAGEEFADAKFHPVWAKAEELGILLFIHPQTTVELAKRFRGNGWLSNVIGNPLDTTIALSHLIFEGTLDKFPGLKICAAHGGGFLPSYAPRSDNGLRVAPEMDTGVKLKKHPTEYLRQMYFDTLVFSDEALRHLAVEVGVSQLVIGTDHPIPWQEQSVDHILNCPHFTDAEKRGMLGETASKLLGIAQF
jgi:aminocarboxymuconate-semialdehyde decarboxylase